MRTVLAPTAPAFAGSPIGQPAADELQRFAALQRRLAPLVRDVFPDPLAPQTVVVVPSLSLDAGELAKLEGAPHYEERLLCLLMLLRHPRTRLVYVTSQPLPPSVIDYYLHLLPGVPLRHARRRLTLLDCADGSPAPLSAKLLARPRLLERVRAAIPDAAAAHLTCFNSTPLERTLAVRLGLPLYACDPSLAHLGSKSGSRALFRRAGVPMLDGVEALRDAADLAAALAALRRRDPGLRRAVVKLNEGFSGEGNALFAFDGAPDGRGPGGEGALTRWVLAELPRRLRFECADERWERYADKFARMGGIAEAFLECPPGGEKRSPSVQCRVEPTGAVQVISTHDQVLGGPSGQVYLGCTFPADPAYARDLREPGERVAAALRDAGVIGRFAVDFVSVRRGDRWEHRAIEINLRKGGTTHPFLMLQFLTDGAYDATVGEYRTPAGRACCYVASDNVRADAYRGLTPDDLVDIAVDHGLHFDAAAQEGVVFHLVGALSEHGKLGAVCVAATPERAAVLYRRTLAVLDAETTRPAEA